MNTTLTICQRTLGTDQNLDIDWQLQPNQLLVIANQLV
jgi:hypothetical protein